MRLNLISNHSYDVLNYTIIHEENTKGMNRLGHLNSLDVSTGDPNRGGVLDQCLGIGAIVVPQRV